MRVRHTEHARPGHNPNIEHKMKKALLAGLALASLTSIATAGQTTTVYPAPAAAPCPATCPWTTELGFKYGFANSDIFRGFSDSVDTYGGDLTFVYHVDPHHSFNLRGGYTYGHDSYSIYNAAHKINLHTFYLMPGYRYTHTFNERWLGYIGANVGAANLSLKDNLRGEDFQRKDHNSEYGLAYSGEVGLRYRLCETKELFLAYEFFGSNATPSVRDGSTKKQTYNVVRTGMSFKF